MNLTLLSDKKKSPFKKGKEKREGYIPEPLNHQLFLSLFIYVYIYIYIYIYIYGWLFGLEHEEVSC